MQFDASVIGGELPVCLELFSIAPFHYSFELLSEQLKAFDAVSKAGSD